MLRAKVEGRNTCKLRDDEDTSHRGTGNRSGSSRKLTVGRMVKIATGDRTLSGLRSFAILTLATYRRDKSVS